MDEYQSIMEVLMPAIQQKIGCAPAIFNLWFGEFTLTSFLWLGSHPLLSVRWGITHFVLQPGKRKACGPASP